MAPARIIEAKLQTFTSELTVGVPADSVVHQVVKDKLDVTGNIAVRHLPDGCVVKHGHTFQDVAVSDEVALAVVVIATVQCTPEYFRPKLNAFFATHGVAIAALLGEDFRHYRCFHSWADDEDDDFEDPQASAQFMTFFGLSKALHIPIPTPTQVHMCVNTHYGSDMALCVARYERSAAMAALDDILCLLLLHGMKQQHLHLLRGVEGPLDAGLLMECMSNTASSQGHTDQPMHFLKNVPLDDVNILNHFPWTSRGGGQWTTRPPSKAPGGAEGVWMMVDYITPGGAQWVAAYACGDSEFWVYLSELEV